MDLYTLEFDSIKGRKVIAKTDIPIGKTVLIDRAIILNYKSVSNVKTMLDLINRILTFENGNCKLKEQFINLIPFKLDKLAYTYRFIFDLPEFKKNELIKKIDDDTILLYFAKYMRNGFYFGDRPAILLNGAMFNHSCIPNVKTCVNQINNSMNFANIAKDEEMCISYGNINTGLISSKVIRNDLLMQRYAFSCKCNGCS